MTTNEHSISKRVNEFIKSLTDDVHSVHVYTNDKNETIIVYEDYEHEPIINFRSKFLEYRTEGERQRVEDYKLKYTGNPRGPLSDETKEKISKRLKGKKKTDEHALAMRRAREIKRLLGNRDKS